MKSTLFTAISIAAAMATMNSAQAASVNLASTEATVGLNYTIGFAATVSQDEVDDVSRDQTPVSVSVNDFVSGTRPITGTLNTIGVNATASSAITIDNDPGVSNPKVSGEWSASASLFDVTGDVVAGGVFASTDVNQFNLAFEVLDDPVDILVSFATDRSSSILRIRKSGASSPVVQMGSLNVTPVARTLDPGSYTLNTFFGFSASAGSSSGDVSTAGSGSFSLTFEDVPLTVAAPVPLPAGVLFLGTGLIGFAGLRRVAQAKQAA